jgi:hypothetical protein
LQGRELRSGAWAACELRMQLVEVRQLCSGGGRPSVVVHCISTTLCSEIDRTIRCESSSLVGCPVGLSRRRMGEPQHRACRRDAKAGDQAVPGRTQDQVRCMHSADARRCWHHSTVASMVRTVGPTSCSLDSPRQCLASPQIPHHAPGADAASHRQRLAEGHGRPAAGRNVATGQEEHRRVVQRRPKWLSTTSGRPAVTAAALGPRTPRTTGTARNCKKQARGNLDISCSLKGRSKGGSYRLDRRAMKVLKIVLR